MLNWFSNRDNITFLIAIIGFAMSIYSVIRNAIRSAESYTIEVTDYAYRRAEVIQFLVCISNLSDEPLSITEISVFGTTCELYPKMIYGKPENWNFRHTAEFPVCIPAHGCQYAFLEFLGENFRAEQLTPESKVCFEIRSTRKRVQKTVVLGNESHYLHAKKQPQCVQAPD